MGDAGVQLQFFRERLECRFPRAAYGESEAVAFANVDGFIGAIVASGQASLRELNTVYTLEEAFDLWEIVMTTRVNEYLAANRK
jgi:hypothetical protein